MKLQVENQKISVIDKSIMVGGTTSPITATFYFSSEWDGMTKKACFRSGTTGTLSEVALTNDSCTIPSSTIVSGQDLYIGVYGEKTGIWFPTIWADPVPVKEGVTLPTT